MSKEIDLRNDPIKKLFYHYLFASVTGMLVKSIHGVLDGIFVGNGVADVALGAVNMVMPVFSLFMGVIMMIGVGGSTLVSMNFGEDKEQNAKNVFVQSLILMIIVGIIAQILFLINPVKICRFLGADDVILDYTVEYGTYLIYFAPFFAIAIGLNVFVRNDADPRTSMYSMVISAVVNATLNYIFIFPMRMGLKGAAVATGIAQIVSCLILFTHFIRKKGKLRLKTSNFKFSINDLIRTCQIGFPSFLGEISFGVVSLAFNRVLMGLGGALAVSAFSIMMYVTNLTYMVFFGIGQAVQPIISFNYGAKKYERVYKSFHMAVKTGVILGIIFTVVGLFFVKDIVMLFNRDNPELIEMAVVANRFLFYTFAVAAYNICISTFFQSTGNAKISSALTFLRSFVIELSLLFILTNIYGLFGTWLVYPLAEIIALAIGLYFMKFKQDIIPRIY